MLLPTVLVLMLVLVPAARPSCTNQPSCFKKGLFKFGMPADGLYPVSVGDLNVSGSAVILGYGDFNNDLYNDVLLSDSQKSQIEIFVWDTESLLFVSFWKGEVPDYDNVYLLDCNHDGRLDLAVYDSLSDSQSLLTIFLNDNQTL